MSTTKDDTTVIKTDAEREVLLTALLDKQKTRIVAALKDGNEDADADLLSDDKDFNIEGIRHITAQGVFFPFDKAEQQLHRDYIKENLKAFKALGAYLPKEGRLHVARNKPSYINSNRSYTKQYYNPYGFKKPQMYNTPPNDGRKYNFSTLNFPAGWANNPSFTNGNGPLTNDQTRNWQKYGSYYAA